MVVTLRVTFLNGPRSGITDVYRELIPYLVQKQFARPFPFDDLLGDQSDIQLARTMSYMFEPDSDPINGCYALVMPDQYYCTRINSLPAYARANLVLCSASQAHWALVHRGNRADDPAHAHAKISKSLIAANVHIGEGAVLRDSVIGPGCSVGPNAVVTRSVLLDGAHVAAR